VYVGDSESLVTCAEIGVEELFVREGTIGEPVQTRLYVPAPWLEGYAAEYEIYWVHTECQRPQALHPYLFPLARRGDILQPAMIEGQLAQAAEIAEGTAFGAVVIPPGVSPAPPRSRRRRKR
jgi:hypothetical protein